MYKSYLYLSPIPACAPLFSAKPVAPSAKTAVPGHGPASDGEGEEWGDTVNFAMDLRWTNGIYPLVN